ncbi:MAG: SecDF P1 head subdomain-containing protein, partial [Akkermansiaceae bacterium]
MKSLIALIFFASIGISCGDILRVSEVAKAAGEDVERMVLKTKDGEEVLFVRKKVVIGDSDVVAAQVMLPAADQMHIELNEAGRKKIKESTSRMNLGQDRMAFIINGRVISAPVVQDTLGDSLLIGGFGGMKFNDLQDIVRNLSGLPPWPEDKHEKPAKPFPEFETVPFTEEEYQANKAQREKMGIFYIESVPTEADLDKLLRKGMGREEVLRLLGKPHMTWGKQRGAGTSFFYEIAPEKRPINPEREVVPNGFKIDFKDGKVSWWSLTRSDAPRKKKVVGRQEPTLKATFPEMSFTKGKPDFLAYVEGMAVVNPKQTVNKRDLDALVSIAVSLASILERDPEKTTL